MIPIHSDDAMFSKPDSLDSRLRGNDDAQLVTGVHGAVRVKWYEQVDERLGELHADMSGIRTEMSGLRSDVNDRLDRMDNRLDRMNSRLDAILIGVLAGATGVIVTLIAGIITLLIRTT